MRALRVVILARGCCDVSEKQRSSVPPGRCSREGVLTAAARLYGVVDLANGLERGTPSMRLCSVLAHIDCVLSIKIFPRLRVPLKTD